MHKCKKMVSIMCVLAILCMGTYGVLGAETTEKPMVEQVLLSQDFEGDATEFDYITVSNSLHSVEWNQDDSRYLELKRPAPAETDTASINVDFSTLVSEYEKYYVEFDVRISPHTGGNIYLYAGNLWKLSGINQGNNYGLLANDSGKYPCVNDAHRKEFQKGVFYTYRITIERLADNKRNVSLQAKERDNADWDYLFYQDMTERSFEGVSKYDRLYIKYNNTYADLAIDNIVVKGYSDRIGVTSLAFDGIADELELDEGADATLSINAEAMDGIRDVQIYVDDVLLETLTTAPYSVTVPYGGNPQQTVAAVATSIGGDVKTVSVQLRYSSPGITTLDFVGSLHQTVGASTDLTIDAKAKAGIEKIEVYLDGVLVDCLTEAPYNITVPYNGKSRQQIRAVATCSNPTVTNAVAEKTATILYSKSEVFYQQDFEADADERISTFEKNGTIGIKPISESHGNSLVIGARENPGGTELPYIDIQSLDSEHMTLDLDLKIDGFASNSNDGNKMVMIAYFGSNQKEIFRFRDENRLVLLGGGLEIAATELNLDAWMHLSLDTDVVTKRATVTINGKSYTKENYLPAGTNNLSSIRLYGPCRPNSQGVGGFIAIDEIRATRHMQYDLPDITFDGIDYAKNDLIVAISTALDSDSVNTDTILVEDARGIPVAIEKLFYDKEQATITLRLAGSIGENAVYAVTFASEVAFVDGVQMGEAVRSSFTTPTRELNYTAVCSEEGEYCKAKVTVTLPSAPDGLEQIYVVLTLWNGTKAVGMGIEALPVPADAGSITTHDLKASMGNATEAHIYVYSDIKATRLLGGKIIKHNLN